MKKSGEKLKIKAFLNESNLPASALEEFTNEEISNFSSKFISGDNEEEKQLFDIRKEQIKNYLLYSFRDFEQAWKKASEETSDSAGDLFPIAKEIDPFEASEMADWHDIDNFDLNSFDLDEDYQFSPCFDQEKEKQPSTSNSGGGLPLEEPSSLCTPPPPLDNINPTMLSGHEDYYMSDISKQQMKPSQITEEPQQQTETSSQLSDGFLSQQMMFGSGGFNILALAAEDPDPYPMDTSTPTVDPSAIQPQSSVTFEAPSPAPTQIIPAKAIKKEPESPQTPTTTARILTRGRRKSAQTSRNIQDDSQMFQFNEDSINMEISVPVKFENMPLAKLNGIGNRSRHASTSSTSTIPAPTKPRQSRSGEDKKRKRKYEEEDVNDPSVKNAKAAKMNRDKKKRQLQDLQNQVKNTQNENQVLKQKIETLTVSSAATERQLRNESAVLRQQLAEERRKNASTSMSGVKMMDYMQKVIVAISAPLNQSNSPVPQVFMSPQLANLPMPPANEMAGIQRQLAENPGAANDNMYLTAKVRVGGVPSIIFDCAEEPRQE